MHLAFICAKARQSITNVLCPDCFLLLWLGITCFPVQTEELTIFVPKSHKLNVHPSLSRWRMPCFEVNILKQRIINGTVGTGLWAAVLLGCLALCQGNTNFSFDKKQSKSLAAPDCAFGILSDNSVLVFSLPPSLPPFCKVSLSCLPAQSRH